MEVKFELAKPSVFGKHVITSLLGWTYNVFSPSYDPSNLTHYGAFVTADFTTHGESHFYGLPYLSADSLDPMDHFFTFDVYNIIPKNMQKFPYVTFKPFLVYIRRLTPKTVYIEMCAKGQIVLEFSLI